MTTYAKHLILLASQRTGSTWLVQLLNNVPSYEMKGEMFLNRAFNPTNEAIIRNYKPDSIYNYKARTGRYNDTERYLTDICFRSYFKENPEVLGFKLMYDQMAKHPQLIWKIKERAAVVHLVRRNKIKLYVSRLRNTKYGINHSFNLKGSEQIKKVKISIPHMLIHLIKLHFYEKIAKTLLVIFRFNHLQVAYEDLVDNEKEQVEKIMNFVGIHDDVYTLSSRTHKIASGQLENEIVNYQQVSFFLRLFGLGKEL